MFASTLGDGPNIARKRLVHGLHFNREPERCNGLFPFWDNLRCKLSLVEERLIQAQNAATLNPLCSRLTVWGTWAILLHW